MGSETVGMYHHPFNSSAPRPRLESCISSVSASNRAGLKVISHSDGVQFVIPHDRRAISLTLESQTSDSFGHLVLLDDDAVTFTWSSLSVPAADVASVEIALQGSTGSLRTVEVAKDLAPVSRAQFVQLGLANGEKIRSRATLEDAAGSVMQGETQPILVDASSPQLVFAVTEARLVYTAVAGLNSSGQPDLSNVTLLCELLYVNVSFAFEDPLAPFTTAYSIGWTPGGTEVSQGLQLLDGTRLHGVETVFSASNLPYAQRIKSSKFDRIHVSLFATNNLGNRTSVYIEYVLDGSRIVSSPAEEDASDEGVPLTRFEVPYRRSSVSSVRPPSISERTLAELHVDFTREVNLRSVVSSDAVFPSTLISASWDWFNGSEYSSELTYVFDWIVAAVNDVEQRGELVFNSWPFPSFTGQFMNVTTKLALPQGHSYFFIVRACGYTSGAVFPSRYVPTAECLAFHSPPFRVSTSNPVPGEVRAEARPVSSTGLYNVSALWTNFDGGFAIKNYEWYEMFTEIIG